jgi:hypothetical protein
MPPSYRYSICFGKFVLKDKWGDDNDGDKICDFSTWCRWEGDSEIDCLIERCSGHPMVIKPAPTWAELFVEVLVALVAMSVGLVGAFIAGTIFVGGCILLDGALREML